MKGIVIGVLVLSDPLCDQSILKIDIYDHI